MVFAILDSLPQQRRQIVEIAGLHPRLFDVAQRMHFKVFLRDEIWLVRGVQTKAEKERFAIVIVL